MDVQQSVDKAVGLALRIESGDADAERELVHTYQRAVQLILLKRTGNAHLANDLTQDTFIITLKKLRAGELKNPDSLAVFIRQIAINLSIQHFRSEKRYVNAGDGIIELQTAQSDNKEKELDSKTTRDMIEVVLNQLAVDRDRELLRRFYFCDEDKEEICSALQLTTAHFDRVLYRAKQRMRELIDSQKGLKALLFGSLLDG